MTGIKKHYLCALQAMLLPALTIADFLLHRARHTDQLQLLDQLSLE